MGELKHSALPRRRVGVLGGSFDPVHSAHVALARQALQSLRLDEVLWVPAGQPWQKAAAPDMPPMVSAQDRCAMVALALEHDNEPRFTLSRLEIDRTGPSYTIDTLHELHQMDSDSNSEFFLILGQDQYAKINTWHRWRDILASCTLAVAARAGQAPQASPEVSAVPHALAIISMPEMAISSTQIRHFLRSNPSACAHDLVPQFLCTKVAVYIEDHGFYRI